MALLFDYEDGKFLFRGRLELTIFRKRHNRKPPGGNNRFGKGGTLRCGHCRHRKIKVLFYAFVIGFIVNEDSVFTPRLILFASFACLGDSGIATSLKAQKRRVG